MNIKSGFPETPEEMRWMIYLENTNIPSWDRYRIFNRYKSKKPKIRWLDIQQLPSEKLIHMKARAFTDGRGNAGNTGSCAAVLFLEDGTEIPIATRIAGEPTNNEAEYEGVKLACLTAIGLGIRELEIYSDSQLIVNQLNGRWRIREIRLDRLRSSIWSICESFDRVTIDWISRDDNQKADALCREIVRRPSPRRIRKHPLYNF